MSLSFDDFLSTLPENPIKTTNNLLDKIINKFSFKNISDLNTINETVIQSKIIIIDKYKKPENEFILVCFDYILVNINLNQFNLMNQFFKQNSDSTLYTLFRNDPTVISNIIKSNLYVDENDPIFQMEISNFSNYFSLKNPKLKKFWNVIKRPIIGFLIKKSYINSYFDRIRNYEQLFNSNNEKIEINQENYINLRLLGNGSSSSVDLIYHMEKEKVFALKIFYNENETEKLFDRENKNYLKVHHPLIARYYGSSKTGSFKSIALEYVVGNSLKSINQLNLSINDKIKIIFEMMIIIEYIHLNKLIYRDLKPNNFILNEKKSLILIDLDRMIEKKFQNSTKSFFHKYCAPEVCESDDYSFEVDIYSLGLLIYFIFFEKDPKIVFDDSFKPIQFPFHEFPTQFSKLKDMCENCTQSLPEKRPNISYLIDEFYFEFFSKIPIQIYEKNTIKSIKDVHSISFLPYWFFIAEKTDPFSIFKLGSFYDNGQFLSGLVNIGEYRERLVPLDSEKVIKYFSIAAGYNIKEAQYNLGLFYLLGLHIEHNVQKSIYFLELAAKQNYAIAQYQLGNIYNEGKYVPRDAKKAFHYLSLAADQQYEKAIYNLGNTFFREKYNNIDLKKAIHYLTIAADLNIKEAQNNLGLIYSSGYVYRDISKAIHYFTLAANQNHPHSLYNLGQMYETGEFVEKDIDKAISYYNLAADLNFAMAQYNLGIIYYYGDNGRKNVTKAIHYFTMAANNNDVLAFDILGSIYMSGKDIEKDDNKGIYYITRAANFNHPSALFKLGFYYFFGLHCSINKKKGIYYFSLAAKYGYHDANFYLGFIYFENKILSRNIEKTINYYKEASSFNNQYAKNNLAIIYKNGYDVKPNIGYAIILLKEAIKQKNDKVAMYNLANLYFYNENCNIDINKSIKLLVKSSLLNFLQSKQLLCILLLKKYDKITLNTIQNEISKYDKNFEELSNELLMIIYKYNIQNQLYFDLLFNKYQDIEFIYDLSKNPIQSSNLNITKKESHNIINVNEIFYEGFGFKI